MLLVNRFGLSAIAGVHALHAEATAALPLVVGVVVGELLLGVVEVVLGRL